MDAGYRAFAGHEYSDAFIKGSANTFNGNVTGREPLWWSLP